MAKLTKTSIPGVYRRHVKACDGTRRCGCSYVVVSEHRGKQTTETVDTFGEAREKKGNQQAGGTRPTSKVRCGPYFEGWIKSYGGRTSRGFSETTRPEYERPIRAHALSRWKGWKLSEIEPADVRELFGKMRAEGCSTSQIRKLRAALSVMFATAVDDSLLRSNPVQGVRIPAARDEGEAEGESPKALTRKELALLIAVIPGALEAVLRVPHRHRPADQRGHRAALGAPRSRREPEGKSPRTVLPGQAPQAQERCGAARPAALAGDEGAAARPPPRQLPRPQDSGLRLENGDRADPRQARRTSPDAGRDHRWIQDRKTRRGRGRQGEVEDPANRHLPHVPPHMRLAALRRRAQHQAGAGVARPC